MCAILKCSKYWTAFSSQAKGLRFIPGHISVLHDRSPGCSVDYLVALPSASMN